MLPTEIRKELIWCIQEEMAEHARVNRNIVSKMYETGLLQNEGMKLSFCETFVEYALQLFLRQVFPDVSNWVLRGFTVSDHVKLDDECADNLKTITCARPSVYLLFSPKFLRKG